MAATAVACLLTGMLALQTAAAWLGPVPGTVEQVGDLAPGASASQPKLLTRWGESLVFRPTSGDFESGGTHWLDAHPDGNNDIRDKHGNPVTVSLTSSVARTTIRS